MPPSFQVLYESGPCLVVLKPAGVLTQAPPGLDSLEVWIKNWLKEREGKAGNIYLGVPHRMDRPVSGAMVFARHVRAATRISRQFENRAVRKIYWACVEGEVTPAEGTWTDYLYKIHGIPKSQIVASDHPEARRAVLHYRTLGQTPWGSWLEIELETGRTHQIRIQASSRGFPVLGDEMYGAAVSFGTQHEDERLRAIALHGRLLALKHPMTDESISITAPLFADWRALKLELPDTDYL